ECHAIGAKRALSLPIDDEPVAMLLKQSGRLLGNERRNPDGWFEASAANLIEDRSHTAAEGRAGIEPITHRALVPVVDLDVLESRNATRDRVEVVENLLRGDGRPEAVPGTPARRRCPRANRLRRWVMCGKPGRDAGEELCGRRFGREHHLLERPHLPRT